MFDVGWRSSWCATGAGQDDATALASESPAQGAEGAGGEVRLAVDHAPAPLHPWRRRVRLAVAERIKEQWRTTLARYDLLNEQAEHHPNGDILVLAHSRLTVAAKLMSGIDPWASDEGCARAPRELRTMNLLLDNVELLLEERLSAALYCDRLRLVCLETARAHGLPPALDPEFDQRLVQLDSIPLRQLVDSVAAQGCFPVGAHPFEVLAPRFSCWTAEPRDRALDLDGWAPRAIPSKDAERLHDQLELRGAGLGRSAVPLLQLSQGADVDDLEAMLDLMATLPLACWEQLALSGTEIVPVRLEGPRGQRWFGHLSPSMQAVFLRDEGVLLVATTASASTQGGRAVPAGWPSDPQRPAGFWMAVGDALNVGSCNSASQCRPYAAPARWAQEAVEHSHRYSIGCSLDTSRASTFLRALMADAASDTFEVPLGRSEREAFALCSALYLTARPLPPALLKYFNARFEGDRP